MLNYLYQQLGIDLTQLPLRFRAPRLIDFPYAFPVFEQQLDLPSYAQQRQRLFQRQLGGRQIGHNHCPITQRQLHARGRKALLHPFLTQDSPPMSAHIRRNALRQQATGQALSRAQLHTQIQFVRCLPRQVSGQIQPFSVRPPDLCTGMQTRQPISATSLDFRQLWHAPIAQISQTQSSCLYWQGLYRGLRIVGAPGGQKEPIQSATAQRPSHLRFQCGRTGPVAATTSPYPAQTLWQKNHAAILHVYFSESLQQRQCARLQPKDSRHSRFQYALEAFGRRTGKTLFQPLRRNRDAQDGRSLRQLLITGGGVSQPGENQNLDKTRACQLHLAPDEAAFSPHSQSGFAQNFLQCMRNLWYVLHSRNLSFWQCFRFRNLILPEELPGFLFLSLMPMGAGFPRPSPKMPMRGGENPPLQCYIGNNSFNSAAEGWAPYWQSSKASAY